MEFTADVVIIGAGIQGLSAAYHLAKRGISNVIVVEKEFIGAGSSGRSASMLMMQRENDHKIRLSQYSYKHYMDFEREFGVDPGFRKIGFLSVVPKSKESISLMRAGTRKAMGVRTEVLTPDDIKKLVPVVNVDDIVCGVYGPEDGVIDPVAIMGGFASAATKLGVTIKQGTEATGVRLQKGRVVGVETKDGLIATPFVVNAAGADAIDVGRWVGLQMPINNRRRSIYLTENCPEIAYDTPMVEDAEAEWYYRKEREGVLMGMGKESSQEVSMSPNWEFFRTTVVEFAIHRVPVLAEAKVERGWSGIRSLTPDINPIIGPVEGIEGFVNSCGWGGEGIMHAPAGGIMVAELISGTTDRTFGLEPFLASRFKTLPHQSSED